MSNRTCYFEGCDKPRHSRGLCTSHAHQRNKGKPLTPILRTLDTRFWAKAQTGDISECWMWGACLNEDGYGEFHRDGRAHGAHRVSYELSYGAIPTGMEIDHTCHNPPCVNPGHLRATTHAQNGQNRSPHYGGDPSKTRGVSWHKGHRAYQARVGLNGHQTHLGFFANREDALRVVAAYRREHMPYSVNDAKEDA